MFSIFCSKVLQAAYLTLRKMTKYLENNLFDCQTVTLLTDIM